LQNLQTNDDGDGALDMARTKLERGNGGDAVGRRATLSRGGA
jgi:hypothetical protein